MHLSFRNRASTNLFLLFDRLGIHLLPKHYYTPVSDYSWLRKNRQIWEAPSDMSGVHWDLDEQLSWLQDTCAEHLNEVAGLEAYRKLLHLGLGYGYGPIESQVLHCFIRRRAPRRIIEVGSGVSTACMLDAVRRNEAEGRPATEILCIEPFPKKHFTDVAGIAHLQAMVQAVDRGIFDRLDDGDLLFIDSSHSVKTGSDVSVLFLQVLPRLRPGVYVHIHDINLPYLYVRDALTTLFGWQETALLAALLSGNSHLRVKSSLSGLHYGRQLQLSKLFRDYRPQSFHSGLAAPDESPDLHFPSSIYLQTT
jgi:predicted O-methyltransferase YrrM